MRTPSAIISLVALSGLAFSETGATTIPAFVWSSGGYLGHTQDQRGLQAIYEAISASELTNRVFGGQSGSGEKRSKALEIDATALHKDKAVSVLVLGDLRGRDFSERAGTSALRTAAEEAPSSVYLPNLEITGADLRKVVKPSTNFSLQLGDCGKENHSLGKLLPLLEQKAEPFNVLICEDRTDSAVPDVQSALEAAKRHFIFVYLGKADEVHQRPTARSLIADSANQDKLCTGKCMVQVRLFECLILLIILLTALGTGLCMLHILDTPSRFETEKKETSRHQD